MEKIGNAQFIKYTIKWYKRLGSAKVCLTRCAYFVFPYQIKLSDHLTTSHSTILSRIRPKLE